MIMPFINTEVTSKQCDALIFFPLTQIIICNFEDNYKLWMFFAKAINPIFHVPGISQNAFIFVRDPFTP